MKKPTIKQSIAIAIFLIIAGVFIFFAARELLPASEDKVAVVIPEGSSVNDISRILEKKEVIGNIWVFKFYAFSSGKTDKLLPGRYVLEKNSAYRKVISDLVKGPKKLVYNLTIPEGFTLEQIGDRLSSIGGLDQKEFNILVSDLKLYNYSFLQNNKSSNLEGYLFPETYRMDADTQVPEIINTMLTQFQKEYSQIKKRAMPVKLNVHQVTTLASLIEREAKLKDEQPLIAAVIYNRLKKNMRLEIDATIQYALGKNKKKLTLKDLEVASPYNTYKNVGLPPAPIGSPGRDALKAALNPAKVDYIYYVLINEKTGKHFFTKDYKEFLKAKRSRK